MPKRKKSRLSASSFKYFVTTMYLDEKDKKYLVRSRTPGFYDTFKRAERCVLKNEGDLFEIGYYNYAVIERVGPGLYYYAKNSETWYKAGGKKYKIGDDYRPTVKKVSKPKKLRQIVNFGIG